MDKGLGYLKCNGYRVDLESKYYIHCRMTGLFFIVVRVRDGGADLEWDYVCERQCDALRIIGGDIIAERFKELHEKYLTGYFSPDQYGVQSHNGKIFGLTVESAYRLASELNIYLLGILHQYENKESHHER